MQHLNPFRLYDLAAKLHGLFNNQPAQVADLFGPLTEIQAALDALIKGEPFALDASKPDAIKLLNKIGAIFNKYYIDAGTKQLRAPDSQDHIEQHEITVLRSLVELFGHSLAADLNKSPVYIVSKRGIYFTQDLIENAHLAFSAPALTAIPSGAQSEFDSAGRALAFGLGTAASMHMLRAIEITLKEYYELFAGVSTPKAERNFGIYLKKLASMAEDEAALHKPDRRLLQMLAQIREQFRNPLITTEISVSVDQATSLFGLAVAIISQMAEGILNEMKAKPVTNAPENALAKLVEANREGDDLDFHLSEAV